MWMDHKLHWHNLAIIVVRNLFSIGLYRINMNVIHLLVLFEHWYHVHCLNTNVISMFLLFRHRCCMFICVVYTWKLCTQLPCLNNVWHSCLNNTNLWNNRFCTNLKQTHEAYKFVMMMMYGWMDGCSLICFTFQTCYYLVYFFFRF
jgi:hypothetical protein